MNIVEIYNWCNERNLHLDMNDDMSYTIRYHNGNMVLGCVSLQDLQEYCA